MAICTKGRLYCSMAQVNTDTKVFCLFMSKLAALMNKEEWGSVSRCLLLIDGAKYQTNKESINHMQALGFNVIVSSPYSYAAAPIEVSSSDLFNLLSMRLLSSSQTSSFQKGSRLAKKPSGSSPTLLYRS